MENLGSFSVFYHLGNVIVILRCLVVLCGLIFLRQFYQKGMRYMSFFIPMFIIAGTGVVYNSVTIWTYFRPNCVSFCEFEKLEELLVMAVIESYIIFHLSDPEVKTKYYHTLRIVVWVMILVTQVTMVYRFITAEDVASCKNPENSLRTIIDIHMAYIFLMLPQFTTAASIMYILPQTDKEANKVIGGKESSTEIQPVCTEMKIHSSSEANIELVRDIDPCQNNSLSPDTTLRDGPPCTIATTPNNPDEYVAKSSKHVPFDNVTVSHTCCSCDDVTTYHKRRSRDVVTKSLTCPLCGVVTASRHFLSFYGITVPFYCTASRNYLARDTSRFCLSCSYLNLSQFLIFVYLSIVIWGLKPLSIFLQEFRYIDRHDINGFILLPPFLLSMGVYLLSIRRSV